MITRVIALSWAAMRELATGAPEHLARHVFLCIDDPGQESAIETTGPNILKLQFHDVGYTQHPAYKAGRLNHLTFCNDRLTDPIVKLLLEYHIRDLDYWFYVGASSGICRAGAVVKFAHRILLTDPARFDIDNPHIVPNAWVYDMLIRQWDLGSLISSGPTRREQEMFP